METPVQRLRQIGKMSRLQEENTFEYARDLGRSGTLVLVVRLHLHASVHKEDEDQGLMDVTTVEAKAGEAVYVAGPRLDPDVRQRHLGLT